MKSVGNFYLEYPSINVVKSSLSSVYGGDFLRKKLMAALREKCPNTDFFWSVNLPIQS